MVPASGALAPRYAAALAPPSAGAYFLGGAGSLTRPPAARGACMVGVGRAGTKPRLRRHCPVLAALRSGLKKVCGPALPLRGCGSIPTPRLRALRGGPPAPAGRGCPGRVARCAPVARRSGCAAAALRSGRGRRSLRGSPCACFPAAPWVAALPVRLLGGAVAVARRARAAAPGFARPCRGRPPGPASPPRFVPPLAPAGGLRGSRAVALVGRAVWRSAPRRGFVLWLARWCACGRGVGCSAGCGQRGRPARRGRAGKVTSSRCFPYKCGDDIL